MTGLPPTRDVNANDVMLEGYVPGPDQPAGNVDYFQTVSLDYSRTMGIPVVKGRNFEAHGTGHAARQERVGVDNLAGRAKQIGLGGLMPRQHAKPRELGMHARRHGRRDGHRGERVLRLGRPSRGNILQTEPHAEADPVACLRAPGRAATTEERTHPARRRAPRRPRPATSRWCGRSR